MFAWKGDGGGRGRGRGGLLVVVKGGVGVGGEVGLVLSMVFSSAMLSFLDPEMSKGERGISEFCLGVFNPQVVVVGGGGAGGGSSLHLGFDT